MNLDFSLLCLDLGNTTCRGGIWKNGKIYHERTIPTKDFARSLKNWIAGWDYPTKICYCSVVPEAEKALQSLFSENKDTPFFCLSAASQRHLPIEYPRPNEIGSDRIANSYAVFKKYPLPAIVIDLGTATTFDVITAKGGYIGGVIVPGPQGMLDYLGNRTALLPKILLTDTDRTVPAIGKSTDLAIMSGLYHGYLPMLNAILKEIVEELKSIGEAVKTVVQTGGEAKNYLISGAKIHPSLTLDGLALACIGEQAYS